MWLHEQRCQPAGKGEPMRGDGCAGLLEPCGSTTLPLPRFNVGWEH